MHILPSTLPATPILVALATLTTTACQQTPTTPATPAAAAPATPSTLEADVAHLKDITPAQSHTMIINYDPNPKWPQ